MTRLERPHDRAREDLIASALERAWERDVRRYHDGEYSPVDFVVYDCRVPMALVEMKCRDNPDDAYPTLYMAERKLTTLVTLGGEWGVPGLFVGAFSNGVIRCVSARRCVDLPVQQIARVRARASGDVGPNDTELGRAVPIARMKVVATLTRREREQYNALMQRAQAHG